MELSAYKRKPKSNRHDGRKSNDLAKRNKERTVNMRKRVDFGDPFKKPDTITRGQHEGRPVPLLIDLDVGVDDAGALILASAHEELVKIVALTTVEGNTDEANVFKNTKYLLKKIGKNYPIYRGLNSMQTDSSHAVNIFYSGRDGLGEMSDREDRKEPLTYSSNKMLSPEAIVHYANKYRGALDIVALGPLTNIADAMELDPDLGNKINSLTVMGGAVNARGNAGVTSEFNIDWNPEAAKKVFEELGNPNIRIVSWELTLTTSLSWKKWNKMLRKNIIRNRSCKNSLDLSSFMMDIEAYMVKRWENDGVIFIDELAMYIYLFPEIAILNEQRRYCTVETKGEFTRGQLVIDWNDFLERKRNCNIVENAHIPKFRDAILEALRCKDRNSWIRRRTTKTMSNYL